MTQMPKRFALGKRRGLPDELASIIITRIESGDFKLGDVLPSEQTLAEMYNVSRTVVREALARLKHEGIILSKRGSGPMVCSTTPLVGINMAIDTEKSLAEFYEFRMLMEGEAAALAAIRHSLKGVRLLASYLSQMEQALDDKTSGADPDYRFHCLIADLAGNEYISSFTKNISTKLWMRVYSARGLSNRTTVRAKIVFEEHAALYQAILSRSPHAARTAAQSHIFCSATRQGIQVDPRHLHLDTSTLHCRETEN